MNEPICQPCFKNVTVEKWQNLDGHILAADAECLIFMIFGNRARESILFFILVVLSFNIKVENHNIFMTFQFQCLHIKRNSKFNSYLKR